MLSYLKCVLCLSVITIAHSYDIETNYSDLKSSEHYYDYQIVNITSGTTEKVALKVYYECLCPDCKSFHRGPLADAYMKGSATEMVVVEGKTVVICQHGEEECYGNKLHACAINLLMNVSRSEAYNTCMMLAQWGGKGSTDVDAIGCGNFMDIPSTPIIECAKSKLGETLLEYYGVQTALAVGKTFVPWVLINGKFFDPDKENLVKRICEALTTPPALCGQYLDFQSTTEGVTPTSL